MSDDPIHSDSSSYTISESISRVAPSTALSKKAPHIVKTYAIAKGPLNVSSLKSTSSSLDPLRDIENQAPLAADESVDWDLSVDVGEEYGQLVARLLGVGGWLVGWLIGFYFVV